MKNRWTQRTRTTEVRYTHKKDNWDIVVSATNDHISVWTLGTLALIKRDGPEVFIRYDKAWPRVKEENRILKRFFFLFGDFIRSKGKFPTDKTLELTDALILYSCILYIIYYILYHNILCHRDKNNDVWSENWKWLS